MAAQTEPDVVAVELEKVRKALPVLYEWEDTFFAGVAKKNVEEISNRDMRIPFKKRPGGYFGQYNPDGGDLGRGAGSVYDKFVVNTQHLRYASEYTLKSNWSTDSPRKAIVDTVKDLTADAMKEFRRALDCLYHTNGTGVLATVTAVAGTNEITCNDGHHGVKLLRIGQKVLVFSADLLTDRTGGVARTITAYDLVEQTVTLSGAAIGGLTATDVLVVEGATTTPPVSLYGIPYFANSASSGTVLGIDRATNPEVRSSSVDAGGGGFSLPYARRAVNLVGDRLGKDRMKKFKAYMHPCQRQAYEEAGQQVSIIQKQAKDEGLDLYFGDLMQMAGATVVDDFKWDMARIDFMDQANWGRGDLKPIDFLKIGGKQLYEVRSSDGGVAAAVLFYIVMSTQAFVDNPAELSYIEDLAIPTGYNGT
jgi:hypothetical protein